MRHTEVDVVEAVHVVGSSLGQRRPLTADRVGEVGRHVDRIVVGFGCDVQKARRLFPILLFVRQGACGGGFRC